MRISYQIREALRGMKSRSGSSLVLIICIASSFLVLGSFLLITLNLRAAEEKLKGDVQIEVYLKDGITPLQLHLLLESTKRLPQVERVAYRSQDKALAQLEHYLGDDLLNELDSNPLPASLRIGLKNEYNTFGHVTEVASKLQGQEGVEDVEFGGGWLKKLDRAFSIFLTVDVIFGILIAVSIIMIVSNFMKLVVLSQAELIQVMRLLGASRADISVPLSIQGLLLGGTGASLGMLSLWAMYSILTAQVIQAIFLSTPVILGLIAWGMILGAGGSLVCLKNEFRSQS
jgi:cell division transport system permease protein